MLFGTILHNSKMRGIGQCIANEFLGEGAHVVVGDIDEDKEPL